MKKRNETIRALALTGAAIGWSMLSGGAMAVFGMSLFVGPNDEDNYGFGLLGLLAAAAACAMAFPIWLWLMFKIEKKIGHSRAQWVFWIVVLMGNAIFLGVLI